MSSRRRSPCFLSCDIERPSKHLSSPVAFKWPQQVVLSSYFGDPHNCGFPQLISAHLPKANRPFPLGQFWPQKYLLTFQFPLCPSLVVDTLHPFDLFVSLGPFHFVPVFKRRSALGFPLVYFLAGAQQGIGE